MSNCATHLISTTTCVYAISDTQNVFDGRGTVSVPHKNTISGMGNASKLADATMLMNTSK